MLIWGRRLLHGVRTVSDEASEIAANNAVPCRTLAIVKSLLDVLCNVLRSSLVSRDALQLGRGKNRGM